MLSIYFCFIDCVDHDKLWKILKDVGIPDHLFQNFPQFIAIHTVKGFGIVNKAEIDVFLEPCFFDDLADVGNLITVHFWGKIFNIAVIQVYALTSNTEEAEVEQLEDL